MEVDIALACVVKTFLESSAYIYEDDNAGILELTLDQINTIPIKENRQQIPRINGYVEYIIPSLSSMEFKSHFRYICNTFTLYTNVYVKN